MRVKFNEFSIALLTIWGISILALIFCLIRPGDFLTISTLLVTAWVIGMQSFETEKMAAYQVMPAIDVRMIYNKKDGTYFWFSNKSNSPGWVSLRWSHLDKRNTKRTKGSHPALRIAPNEEGIKTADSFFQNPNSDDEVNLQVSVKAAFKKLGDESLDLTIEFEKSYKFDRSKNNWNDTSWSFPTDRPFPLPVETKQCPYCKSQVDSRAAKCRYCLSVIQVR